jgi:predicted hotdog family 3-hydroxylacyl-ACP dehydratase
MAFERTLVVALVVGSASLVSTAASAGPRLSEDDRATARALMDEGDAKSDRGDWKGALAAYAAADALVHAPSTGYELGRVQVELGLLLEARETLAGVLRIPAAKKEPLPFTVARKNAEALLADVDARIPTLEVHLVNVDATQTPVITIDGEIVASTAAPAPRRVNPGAHSIVARVGSVERRSHLVVDEREQCTVTLDFAPEGAAPKAPWATPAPPTSGNTRSKALVYGSFGLGAVGVTVGSVAGLISIAKVSDAKKDCVNNVCPEARKGDIDSAKSLGTVSTIAFIAAGVGIGVGVVGLLTSEKESAETSALAKHARPIAPTNVRAVVGPMWTGVTGTF